MLKRLVFILSLLLCLSVAATCSAAEVFQISAEQLQTSDKCLDELDTLIQASKLTISDSAKLIVALQQNSQRLNENLQKSTELLAASNLIIDKMQKELIEQASSLQKSKILIDKLEKEIARLKRNNNLGAYASTSSVGLFATHERLLVYGGQKYNNGGIEVGVGYEVIKF